MDFTLERHMFHSNTLVHRSFLHWPFLHWPDDPACTAKSHWTQPDDPALGRIIRPLSPKHTVYVRMIRTWNFLDFSFA